MTMKQVVRAFRGALGTEVWVEVERNGKKIFPYAPPPPEGLFRTVLPKICLIRADIPVKGVWVEMLDDGAGLIRISQFTEKTAEEFGKAMVSLKSAGATSLALDLRNNPGGVIHAAVEVAGAFLPKSKTVVSTRGQNKNETILKTLEWRSARPDNWPVVVLVNKKTASAAEILAGALQDHKRAVIVGERTFGKASVQQVARLRLRLEVGVKLTVARYFTPNGRMIQGEGITPDIFAGEDALEKAVELLKAARIFGKGAGYAK